MTMTIDQLLRLLSILIWPVIAVTVCTTILKGISLFDKAAQSALFEIRASRKDAIFENTRWISFWASVLQSTMPATVRACMPRDSEDARLAQTSERALLAILQANGGFPGKPSDHVTRQIVREVREMYAELQEPTVVAPVAAAPSRSPGPNSDDLTLDDPEAEAEHDEFTEFYGDDDDGSPY